MKKFRIISLILVIALSFAVFAACSADGFPEWDDMYNSAMSAGENYQYETVVEQDFVSTEDETSSYFSLDRNTASYSLMRRQIEEGRKLNGGSVRIEEYVNYFNYDYKRPTGDNALALGGSVFDCPWNSAHKLLSIAVAAEEITFENDTPNNLVFLIDTSGSMYGSDRLGLIQQAFTMLLDYLDEDDTVSIVTYAGDSRTALDGESGANKVRIATVLEDLQANGSTNGAGGIERAYALAEQHFIEGGNNRVILATDGDFNVGVSSKGGLTSLIREKSSSGIYLSVLGVGMTNTNDTTMNTLATNGNGNYAYLDSVLEARKVLVTELNGTLKTVAKDAKIGVEFNPDVVSKFRLIGYDTKLLTQEQFEDEATDAGEIGAGHTVTAVYEIELKSDGEGAMVTGEIATAEIKYKLPDGDSNPSNDVSKSIPLTYTTDDYTQTPSDDCVFIGCVLEYGLILRNSKYKADADFENVLARLETLTDYLQADEFKAQFAEIVRKAFELYQPTSEIPNV